MTSTFIAWAGPAGPAALGDTASRRCRLLTKAPPARSRQPWSFWFSGAWSTSGQHHASHHRSVAPRGPRQAVDWVRWPRNQGGGGGARGAGGGGVGGGEGGGGGGMRRRERTRANEPERERGEEGAIKNLETHTTHALAAHTRVALVAFRSARRGRARSRGGVRCAPGMPRWLLGAGRWPVAERTGVVTEPRRIVNRCEALARRAPARDVSKAMRAHGGAGQRGGNGQRATGKRAPTVVHIEHNETTPAPGQ